MKVHRIGASNTIGASRQVERTGMWKAQNSWNGNTHVWGLKTIKCWSFVFLFHCYAIAPVLHPTRCSAWQMATVFHILHTSHSIHLFFTQFLWHDFFSSHLIYRRSRSLVRVSFHFSIQLLFWFCFGILEHSTAHRSCVGNLYDTNTLTLTQICA